MPAAHYNCVRENDTSWRPPRRRMVDEEGTEGSPDPEEGGTEVGRDGANGGNGAVQPRRAATSTYRGVCWHRKSRRWQSAINSSGRHVYLGSFDTEEEAARMFDKVAIRVRGNKAKLNFPYEEYVGSDGTLLTDPRLESLVREARKALLEKQQQQQVVGGAGGVSGLCGAGGVELDAAGGSGGGGSKRRRLTSTVVAGGFHAGLGGSGSIGMGGGMGLEPGGGGQQLRHRSGLTLPLDVSLLVGGSFGAGMGAGAPAIGLSAGPDLGVGGGSTLDLGSGMGLSPRGGLSSGAGGAGLGLGPGGLRSMGPAAGAGQVQDRGVGLLLGGGGGGGGGRPTMTTEALLALLQRGGAGYLGGGQQQGGSGREDEAERAAGPTRRHLTMLQDSLGRAGSGAGGLAAALVLGRDGGSSLLGGSEGTLDVAMLSTASAFNRMPSSGREGSGRRVPSDAERGAPAALTLAMPMPTASASGLPSLGGGGSGGSNGMCSGDGGMMRRDGGPGLVLPPTAAAVIGTTSRVAATGDAHNTPATAAAARRPQAPSSSATTTTAAATSGGLPSLLVRFLAGLPPHLPPGAMVDCVVPCRHEELLGYTYTIAETTTPTADPSAGTARRPEDDIARPAGQQGHQEETDFGDDGVGRRQGHRGTCSSKGGRNEGGLDGGSGSGVFFRGRYRDLGAYSSAEDALRAAQGCVAVLLDVAAEEQEEAREEAEARAAREGRHRAAAAAVVAEAPQGAQTIRRLLEPLVHEPGLALDMGGPLLGGLLPPLPGQPPDRRHHHHRQQHQQQGDDEHLQAQVQGQVPALKVQRQYKLGGGRIGTGVAESGEPFGIGGGSGGHTYSGGGDPPEPEPDSEGKHGSRLHTQLLQLQAARQRQGQQQQQPQELAPELPTPGAHLLKLLTQLCQQQQQHLPQGQVGRVAEGGDIAPGGEGN